MSSNTTDLWSSDVLESLEVAVQPKCAGCVMNEALRKSGAKASRQRYFRVAMCQGCEGALRAGDGSRTTRISNSVEISYRFPVNVPISLSATGGFPLRADGR